MPNNNANNNSLSSQGRNPLLDAALSYCRRGWSVIPLKPRDKRPTIDSWQPYQLRLATEEEISKWWHQNPKANIGLVAGAISGFFVVDADGPEAVQTLSKSGLPPTPAVQTSPGKRHYYSRHPGFPIPNAVRIAPGLDIRGDGGYVVAPPSTHPSGSSYQWLPFLSPDDVDLADPPQWLLELIQKQKVAKPQMGEPDWVVRLLKGVPEGQRDDAAIRLCGHWLAKGLQPGEVKGLLLLWNQYNLPPVGQAPSDLPAEKWAEEKVKSALAMEARKEAEAILTEDEVEENRYLYRDKKGAHLDVDRIVHDLLAEFTFRTLRDTEEVLVYRDGVYTKDGEATIKEECRRRVPNSLMTRYKVNEIIAHIKWSTYIKRVEFNTEKWVLNLQNGLYDTRTGTLSDHTPEFLSTIRIPVVYDPNADCPRIKQFLREIVAEEDISTIEESAGYVLVPDNSIHRAFLFVGEGANGKSTVLELWRTFVGKANCASVSLQALETQRFATAALYGKLVNIHADIPSTPLQHVGVFKMATGGDTLRGEEKFERCFDFVNHARFFLSANRPPKIHGEDSLAFWRRWVIINFPNQFIGPNDDKKLLGKLTTADELSGFLNLALKGLKRLLQKGDYSYRHSIEEVAEIYIKAADPIYAFIGDRCETGTEAWISKEDLYTAFVAYCEGQKVPIIGKEAFGRQLKNATNVNASTQRRRVGSELKMGWKGVRLKTEAEEEADDAEIPF
jgi:P4 family phage/plasmid primase-like protien